MLNIQSLRGNINQSVCSWCFDELSIEELCKLAIEIGLVGIDLLGLSDWPVLEKYGLKSKMCNGAEISLEQGWNNKVYPSELLNKGYVAQEFIPLKPDKAGSLKDAVRICDV